MDGGKFAEFDIGVLQEGFEVEGGVNNLELDSVVVILLAVERFGHVDDDSETQFFVPVLLLVADIGLAIRAGSLPK